MSLKQMLYDYLAISDFIYGISGHRLAMIRIGTTDVSPEVLAPAVHNIKVCACQDTPVVDGATQVFQCKETGRYLVVLLEQEEILTLCEVQVFKGTVHSRK